MVSYRIRPSTIADTEILGRIHSQAWQETYAGLMPAEFLATGGSIAKRTEVRKIIFAHTTPRHGHFIVEDDQCAVVGFGDCGPSEEEIIAFAPAEIYTLYLLRHAQGNGLGRKLLSHMFDHLQSKGFTKIGLHTHAQSEESNAFYAHMDGTNIGMVPEKYPGYGKGNVYIWSFGDSAS